MKTRRRVGLRTGATTATTLTDRRREFLKNIYERIQDLPDDQPLPEDIQEEIKKYSRTQNSEKAILRVVEYPVHIVKYIFSTLLQNVEGDILPLLNDLLKQIKLDEPSTRYMKYDTRLKLKLDKYVNENLSAYLPVPEGTLTNVSLDQLQKDLAEFFDKEEDGTVVGNIFEPLFHAFLKEEQIKTFLATCPFITPDGQVSIRPFISKFIDQHRFDLIQELFESGFQPTTPQDWKDALPAEYYEKFPPLLWKLTKWKQFQPFVGLAKNYSLDLNEFIKYSYYKDHKRLILLGQEIKEEEDEEKRKIPIHPSKHAPFFTLYNTKEVELLQRIRPWIEGLVYVLIKPKSNCDMYLGKPYGKYYFPTDLFYRDLANDDVQKKQSGHVFSMKHVSVETDSTMHVYHLLQNGQVLPQTESVFKKSIQYMDQHSRFRIPKIEEYFLSMPLENISSVDQEILREKFKSDLSFILSNTFNDRLDFDAMSSHIISSVFTKVMQEPLQKFLEHVFHIYFLFSPRYNMDLLTPVAKERMNLFFYQLENLDELPVEFYYPQFPFMGQEKQETFLRWQKRCCQHFIIENLYYLFTKNYPILHLKVPDTYTFVSSPPKTILLNIETGDKLTLSHPYLDQYIYLPDVVGSILQHQEYVVHNEPLSSETVSAMEKFFELERVQAGLGSYMMDNEYEIFPTIPAPIRVIHDEPEPSILEELPDFKEKAYQFLELLSV